MLLGPQTPSTTSPCFKTGSLSRAPTVIPGLPHRITPRAAVGKCQTNYIISNHPTMSAISDDEDATTILPPLGNSQRRTTKRWSFHNNLKPDLVNQPPEAAGTGRRRLTDVTNEDRVHMEIDPNCILGGAQLYLTELGRLFHAGKICIVLAGLPGRGKTHLLVALTRYLRWLGVITHLFHLGNYRRAKADVLDYDLFVPHPDNYDASDIRQKIVDECLNDVLSFFKHDRGQIAIYDAVNALPEYRIELHNRFLELGVQVLFIELLVDDDKIVMKNIELAARLLPDYANWDYNKAYADYLARIKYLAPYYQEMGDVDKQNGLLYIKTINFSERIEVHNANHGYLINKVLFFMMNSTIKLGLVFFARCWKRELDIKDDPPLDAAGRKHAHNLTMTLMDYLAAKGRSYVHNVPDRSHAQLPVDQRQPAAGADGIHDESLVVWGLVKRRTIEYTHEFAERGFKIRDRIQLLKKIPGVVGNMTDEQIKEAYPEDYASYIADPYHYRYPRSESYHDLAIKIEPLILEMERMNGDLLIVADDTVIKVFLGYLLSVSCYEIPNLHIAQDEIVEIKFNAYANTFERFKIKSYD